MPNRFGIASISLAAMLTYSASADAASTTVALDPQTTQIGLTIYILGLFPQTAQYERFAGYLVVDPAAPGNCSVDVLIEASSLHMEDPRRTKLALGPSFLDAAHYPSVAYHGSCGPAGANGDLTLHGVTRNLMLTVRRNGDRLLANGYLRRGDFGVNGLPGLIGRRIGINLAVTLPPDMARQLIP